jgi:methylamine---corrinoid protein Co-methyltransferase
MKNTTRMMDIVQRSLNGPIMDEEDFNNIHVSAGLGKVIKEYGIEVDKEHLINFDDDMADRVWNAALDFLAACGVYNQSTGKVIVHSRKELEAILNVAPDRVLLGSGTDAILEVKRDVDDQRPMINMGSPIGSPVSEEYFIPMMQSYAQEPLVDVTCCASMTTVQGYEIRTRSPLEIMSAWEEIDLMRVALNRAGRPGLAWTGNIHSISDIGQLATLGPDGLRSTEMHTFGIISELKTNFEIFNKLTQSIRVGGIVDPYANPIYGGLGGGMEGQAVLLTAEMIALSTVFMAVCCGSSPTHPFNFNDTGHEILRPSSLAFQAIARNSKLLTNLTLTPVGGPATKTLLYECVAFILHNTFSGASRFLGPRSATGAIENHFSGLEARFCGELIHAAPKLDRGKAEEIVQKAYEKYEDQLTAKPYGKPFQEVYDIQTVQPTDEWLKMYDEVKEEAAGWGLDFG